MSYQASILARRCQPQIILRLCPTLTCYHPARSKPVKFDFSLAKLSWSEAVTRSLSSTSKFYQVCNNPDTDSDNRSNKWKLLYRRNPYRYSYPRLTLVFSTSNLLYWTWYVLDFTPSVNASAYTKKALGQIDATTLDLLLVDPTMGYVGLGLALIIFTGSIWYPKRLISAIWKVAEPQGDSFNLAISTLKLPFVQEPSILGKTIYDPTNKNFHGLEHINFNRTELQSDSNIKFFRDGEIALVGQQDIHDIIIKLDGAVSKKRGHLALQTNHGNESTIRSWLPSILTKHQYLLDIESEGEVMNDADPYLLRALMLNEFIEQKTKGPIERRTSQSTDTAENQNDHSLTHSTQGVKETIARRKGYGKRRQ